MIKVAGSSPACVTSFKMRKYAVIGSIRTKKTVSGLNGALLFQKFVSRIIYIIITI